MAANRFAYCRITGMGRKRTIDLAVGQRFGRLVVVHSDIHLQSGQRRVRGARLRCDCGTENFETVLGSLVTGATKSCGCLGREVSNSPRFAKRRILVSRGEQFGRLTVLDPDAVKLSGTRKNRAAKVRCTCGNEQLVPLTDLVRGYTVSCGCWQSEVSKRTIKFAQAAVVKHGASSHPLYPTWRGMVARCFDPTSLNYPGYGGRGITVYAPWAADAARFIFDVEAEIGPRPLDRYPNGQPVYSLDRIDDGNYEPGGVRWATRKEQASNRRRDVLIRQLRTRVAELESQLAAREVMPECQ